MAKKLLLVEDDLATVDSIKICLNIFKPEFELTLVYNGLNVAKTLQSGNFDGIILDLGLPGLDGMLVLKELSQFSNVPVIIISARKNENEIVTAMKLGVKDFIFKPFDYRDFLKSLTEHCEHSVNKSPI